MTGPEMLDVLTWRDDLSSWTSVERAPANNKEERRKADRVAEEILQTAFENNLDADLELLRGEVEDIILEGIDITGAPVPRSKGKRALDSNFLYDLYHLDFVGGLGYQRRGRKPKRLEALEKLFQRQSGQGFILILTINVRDTLREHVISYLHNLRSELGNEWDWYIERKEGEYEHQLKIAVPLFLKHHAEAAHFDCTFLPPIGYEGHEGAHLVHFVCLFRAMGTVFPTRSVQTRADVLALPLIKCAEGTLRLSSLQHPKFSLERCREILVGCCEEIRAVLPNETMQPSSACD